MSAISPIPPQVLVVRAGDDLPVVTAVIENEITGLPVDLTGARVWVRIVGENGELFERECQVINGPAGLVTYDWTVGQTVRLAPHSYDLTMWAYWPATSQQITAPSDRSATLIVRPGTNYVEVLDANGIPIDAVDGQSVVAARDTSLNEGNALLTADGQVIRSVRDEQVFVRLIQGATP